MGILASLVSLAVFASLSLNLIIQFVLGVQEIGQEDEPEPLPLFQAAVLFIAVLLLWFLFFYVVAPFSSFFFEYLLFLPLSVLACLGLEAAAKYLFPQIIPKKSLFDPNSSYNGLVLTALILILHIASNFAEAAVVSLGFSLGVLLSILILRNIRLRSYAETVPFFLRGKPLLLISMGFLSIIFTSTAAVLLNALIGV